MTNYKFSIITVTYNCGKSIIKSLESIITQSYKNFECIIVDGNSNDGTLKIIEEYSRSYDFISFISEKDKGIYDAMNKGIKLAKGQIIYFLNAADVFYKSDVLKNANNYFNKIEADILYGDICTKIGKVNVYEFIKSGNINIYTLMRKRSISHQSMFTKKYVYEKTNKFDLNYKICADTAWFIKAYKLGFTIKHIDLTVCIFDLNGISNNPISFKIIKKEINEIMQKNFGYIYWCYDKIYSINNRIRNMKLISWVMGSIQK